LYFVTKVVGCLCACAASPAGWYFLPLGSWLLAVDGSNLFFIAGDAVYKHTQWVESSLPAGWYFLPLGSKYSCWWMVWNPFSLLRRGYSLRSIPPSQVSQSLPAGYFSTLRVKYSCWWMDSVLLSLCAGIQSTQHPHSSQSVCQLVDIFLPLGVEIFLLADGYPFFITQGYTVYAAFPFRSVDLPAAIFFYPWVEIFCWWMVGNPFFLCYAGIQSARHPQSSRVSPWLDDIF
jgi:hypothetical protein